LYRDTNDLKKGYQARTNIVRMRRVIWFNSHSILARWRNPFSEQLNVSGFHDVRQTEIHTAEPLVPELSASEVEMAIEKLKRQKSPGIDQIPEEFIKAEVK
jgi:hypothetical protein